MTYLIELRFTHICTIVLASQQNSIVTGNNQEILTVIICVLFNLVNSETLGNLNFTIHGEILEIDLKDEIYFVKGAEKRLFPIACIHSLNISVLQI